MHSALRRFRLTHVLIAAGTLMFLVLASACNQPTTDSRAVGNPAPTQDQNEPTIEIEEESTATPAPTHEQALEATPEPTIPPESEETEHEPEVTPTEVSPDPTPEPEQVLEPLTLPDTAFLSDMTHMYQTFNNCSAASVCMLLSHYDIVMDQETLRPIMRPNDGTRHGKTEYMIAFFREQGLEAHLMHGGDIDTLRAFIAHGIPVIVQQWLDLHESDPIGHYSVVRGYDDNAGVFRLNDSMHGEDFHISYREYTAKWQAFSYRYIPVYPSDLQDTVDRILADETDLMVNRERTVEQIRGDLQERPNDAELIYSLGTNLHDLGRYEEAIEAYERAASIGLPPKMLWYVYWPAEAYNELGRHQEAIQVAEQQIASAQTFGDMRYERGRAMEALGQIDLAIAEYNQALGDDPRLTRAEEALERLGDR
jgi:hypothetical protein